MPETCDICNASESMEPLLEASLLGITAAWVYKCGYCGFRQIRPRLQRETLSRIYPGEYFDSEGSIGYSDFGRQAQRSQRAAYFLAKKMRRLLPPEAKILEMQRIWQENYEQTYQSNQPYPENVGWYEGSGGLRKYTFARVKFCPFAYQPQSGLLTYYSAATVSIEYDDNGNMIGTHGHTANLCYSIDSIAKGIHKAAFHTSTTSGTQFAYEFEISVR